MEEIKEISKEDINKLIEIQNLWDKSLYPFLNKIDKPKIEECINFLYSHSTFSGKEKPHIIYTKSPLEAQIFAFLINNFNESIRAFEERLLAQKYNFSDLSNFEKFKNICIENWEVKYSPMFGQISQQVKMFF
ncbi:MAG: hypothetical protein WCO13_13270, partial [Bacteroidota bacterium]